MQAREYFKETNVRKRFAQKILQRSKLLLLSSINDSGYTWNTLDLYQFMYFLSIRILNYQKNDNPNSRFNCFLNLCILILIATKLSLIPIQYATRATWRKKWFKNRSWWITHYSTITKRCPGYIAYEDNMRKLCIKQLSK